MASRTFYAGECLPEAVVQQLEIGTWEDAGCLIDGWADFGEYL